MHFNLIIFMKRFLTVITLVQMTLAGTLVAQVKPSIYLTGYTFSAQKKDVGVLKNGGDAKITSITLSGPDAAAFKIDKGNVLTLRNNVVKPDVKWLDVAITAKTTGAEIKENFRIVRDQFIHNKVVAHRGAWKNTGATENSIAALKHAIDMGCEGSEFDVHLSSDSVLFVNHDDIIQGLTIEKTPSQTLAAVKLSNGESLPTLKDYLLAGMNQNKTKLVLEIKASIISKERGIALTHKVMAMVRELKAEAWVDYISFDYEVCKEVIKLAPYAQSAYLKSDKAPAALAADHLTGLDYHFSIMQKNPDWFKEARAAKVSINVWTVNEEPLMDWLLNEKVDYITTNEPELLLKKLNK